MHFIDTALFETEQLLKPCEPKEFAVIIDKLFKFGRTFGIKADVESSSEFYWDAMQNHPHTIISQAVDRCCAEWTWGNRLPLPGDLQEAVSGELGKLKIDAIKLRQAKRKLES